MQDISNIDLNHHERLMMNISLGPRDLERNSSNVILFNKKDSNESNESNDPFLNKRYSIAFDLDNTLIYSTPLQTKNTTFTIYQPKVSNSRTRSTMSMAGAIQLKQARMDTKISSIPSSTRKSIPRNTYQKFFVQIRPKLIEFIMPIVFKYNIYFYTASQREYAKDIVKNIFQIALGQSTSDEHHSEFQKYIENLDKIIFSREHCTFMNGYELKDLRLLNKPLPDTILIDDIQGSGLFQPKNSLIIPAFYGDTEDAFLMDELLPLLGRCADEDHELIASIREFAVTLSPHSILNNY